MKNEIHQMDISWREKHSVELNRMKQQFEKRIASVTEQNDQVTKKKVRQIVDELDRLNNLMLKYVKENGELKDRNQELLINLGNKDSTIRDLQIEIQSIREENSRLNGKNS